MSGIARIGQDNAEGVVVTGSTNVMINGSGAARLGDVIQGHDDSPHDSPIIVTASSTVFVNGIPVARAGDSASCGHKLSGSDNVSAG